MSPFTASVVYGAGYWAAVFVIVAGIASAIFTIAWLAHRARLAKERYQERALDEHGRDDRQRGNDLVVEYARLRRETEHEMSEARKRLGGMKEAFEAGLKG